MTTQRTPEELANTLEFVAANGVGGLNAAEVLKAASRLREQDGEIKRLNSMLASNKHFVEVAQTHASTPFQTEIYIDVAIADPVRFGVKQRIDKYELTRMQDDMLPHFVGHMMDSIIHKWRRGLIETALPAFVKLRQQVRREFQP